MPVRGSQRMLSAWQSRSHQWAGRPTWPILASLKGPNFHCTASTVTSAALVMVAVFAIFVTLHEIDIKQMGFGLAAAILIDATIVRAVLLPSVMKLLGDWNWYLPRWLEWLPRLEGGSGTAPAVPKLATSE